jgi:hypothetical protein
VFSSKQNVAIRQLSTQLAAHAMPCTVFQILHRITN